MVRRRIITREREDSRETTAVERSECIGATGGRGERYKSAEEEIQSTLHKRDNSRRSMETSAWVSVDSSYRDACFEHRLASASRVTNEVEGEYRTMMRF